MRVLALISYEVPWDKEYRYMEWFETKYNYWDYVWRKRFIQQCFDKGIVCSNIKVIDVKYEK